jgi:cytochrome c-type biogenesis protein CcmH/NrfG
LSTSGAAKDEIAASRRRADSLDRAFEDARLATEIELDALGKLNNRVVIAEIVCVVIALAGLTFSVDAFKQWQVRHQDFQDRLAVAQAERTELEVQALRKQIAREDESVSIQPTP